MLEPAEAEKIADPSERAKTAHALIEGYQDAIGELSRIRREAIEDLLTVDGTTQTQIAEMLGISRSRMSQLLSAGTRPERAFLGTGKLTIAMAAKKETNRSDPGDMVSAEVLSVYELLAKVARDVGLEAEHEVVPPPGLVQLNRPNLIVLTSPRLLPWLGQVMEADPHLRFHNDETTGWYLIDRTTGLEYHSPRNQGEPADYGYIGRLPRPDGRGTFLWLAGIHAQGTLGAARFVVDHLPELYRELKARRFSTIIKCDYKADRAQQIVSVERVTPLYGHEGS